MALTATATSALPTWDETIVPALRKRLESESRILAKRMSIASITSADDHRRSPAPSLSPRTSRDVPRTFPEPRKSSAIPRPSLQYSIRSDTSSSHTRVNGASTSPSVPPKRARTSSQPPSPNGFTNNPLPTPDSSRPTSPRTSDVRPTRIPIAARTRTASTSSHTRSIAQWAESRNGTNHRPYQPSTPDISQDPWAIKPSEQPTTPPMPSVRHQPSNIINEPPPFPTPSITSSVRSRRYEPAEPDPRPSNDSEERPFEHWYRGDVRRNGGVGELRVARHVEMLQIANYGHNLRKAVRGHTRDLSGYASSVRGRKRADSVGTGTRDSIYLDDERTRDVDMVLDESPLTDIETEPDLDPEAFYDVYAAVDDELSADDTIHPDFTASTPGPTLASVPADRSQTPTATSPVLDGSVTPKHKAQVASDPLRSVTPSVPPRTSVESTVRSPRASDSRSRSTSGTISPISQSSDQSHTKNRAKSPGSPASTPRKPKPKAKTLPLASRDPRISIAAYPTPEGNVVDAIPTWTQPVQKSGNWDEVVPPVVARKRGLNGLYEQADGSPKPRDESPPIKPAPGTFGYDYTKYRPPLHEEEEIAMDEFNQSPPHTPPPEEELAPPGPESPPKPIPPPIKPEEPVRLDPWLNPPDSPAPFSHYLVKQQVPTINVTRPSCEMVEQRRQVPRDDDDTAGGCCKCVVM